MTLLLLEFRWRVLLAEELSELLSEKESFPIKGKVRSFSAARVELFPLREESGFVLSF